MTTMIIENKQVSKNWGINCEQSLRYALHGYITHHDNGRYDKCSDIDTISVKSSHFTLVSGGLLESTTRENMISEYFKKVHSTCFAYVSKDMKVYMMNKNEFLLFLLAFTYTENESRKNGGLVKVRARAESKKMIAFLESMI